MSWKGFEALPPYLGGKRRLARLVFARLAEVVSRERWGSLTFVDPFMGAGSISLYAKAQGFGVVASDIAERSAIVGRALLENSHVRLKLGDVRRLMAPAVVECRRIAEEGLVPQTLDGGQAAFVDLALHNAGQLSEPKQSLLKLVLIKWLLGLHPMSSLDAGDARAAAEEEYDEVSPGRLAHYVKHAGAPTMKALWRLGRQVNQGVFPGRARVEKRDVFEFLPATRGDVLYLDPPYPGTSSYERMYEVLDLLLEGHRHRVSSFSSSSPPLQELFEAAGHIPIWAISMGNAVYGEAELASMLGRRRRNVSSLAVPYRHLAGLAGRGKNEANREFIFVAWDDVP